MRLSLVLPLLALAKLSHVCKQPEEWQISAGVKHVCDAYDGTKPAPPASADPYFSTKNHLEPNEDPPIIIREVPDSVEINQDTSESLYSHPTYYDRSWDEQRRRLKKNIYIQYKGVKSVIWKRSYGYVSTRVEEKEPEPVKEEEEMEPQKEEEPMEIPAIIVTPPDEPELEPEPVPAPPAPAPPPSTDDEPEPEPGPGSLEDDGGGENDDGGPPPPPATDDDTSSDDGVVEPEPEPEPEPIPDPEPVDDCPDGGCEPEEKKEEEEESEEKKKKKYGMSQAAATTQMSMPGTDGSGIVLMKMQAEVVSSSKSYTIYWKNALLKRRRSKALPLSEPELCGHTTCVWGKYTDSSGRLLHRTIIQTEMFPYENFHCERVKGTTNCECRCHRKFECTLAHHRPGYKIETFSHCQARN